MNAKISNTSPSDFNMDDEPMRKPGVGSSRDIVHNLLVCPQMLCSSDCTLALYFVNKFN